MIGKVKPSSSSDVSLENVRILVIGSDMDLGWMNLPSNAAGGGM